MDAKSDHRGNKMKGRAMDKQLWRETIISGIRQTLERGDIEFVVVEPRGEHYLKSVGCQEMMDDFLKEIKDLDGDLRVKAAQAFFRLDKDGV